jgi:hypothetical protein
MSAVSGEEFVNTVPPAMPAIWKCTPFIICCIAMSNVLEVQEFDTADISVSLFIRLSAHFISETTG